MDSALKISRQRSILAELAAAPVAAAGTNDRQLPVAPTRQRGPAVIKLRLLTDDPRPMHPNRWRGLNPKRRPIPKAAEGQPGIAKETSASVPRNGVELHAGDSHPPAAVEKPILAASPLACSIGLKSEENSQVFRGAEP